jgi:hypothetical protein
MRWLAHMVRAIALAAALLAGRAESQPRPEEARKLVMALIPGRSIGPVRLGARSADLPRRARLDGAVGRLDGVHFALTNGRIDEVWIDDLRTFPYLVQFRGKPIPRDATLTTLLQLFGPCTEIPDVIGGTRHDCAKGVWLGAAASAGDSIQLRLRRP